MEGWTEIRTEWTGDGTFASRNAGGGSIHMGTSEDKPGMSPMQLLLSAVAGCTGTDLVSILQKKRLNLSNLHVLVRGKRADDYPRIWTDIHLTYLIWGEGISTKDVEQAIKLSEEKYCSVGIMLGKSARMTSDYRILKPGEIPDNKE